MSQSTTRLKRLTLFVLSSLAAGSVYLIMHPDRDHASQTNTNTSPLVVQDTEPLTDAQPAAKEAKDQRPSARSNQRPSDHSADDRDNTTQLASIAAPGTTKDDYVRAVQTGDTTVLSQLLSRTYGEDAELDALLIDGARQMYAVGSTQQKEQAQDALLGFAHFELNSRSPSVPGNQIQIAEALGSINSPSVASHLIEWVQADSLDRVVRGAAVISLGELNASEALPAVEAYMKTLEDELLVSTDDERPFVQSSIDEARQVAEDLRARR
jgi:hypothetical protein